MKKALATLAILSLAAVPLVAQQGHSGGGAAQSGGGGGSSSHGGGGATASSGGAHSSGGSAQSSGGSSHSGSGGTASSAAASGRTGSTNAAPASGVATARGGERGNSASTAGRRGDAAVSSGSAPSSPPSAGRVPADAGSHAAAQPTYRDGRKNAVSGDTSVDTSTRQGRERNGNEPITGKAVVRGSVPAPPPPHGGPIIGYYPLWIGTGLYSGYYGYYGYGYYGGYGYYDPWYGAYPDDPYQYQSSPGYGGGFADEGSLRLKIKPRDAEVYVDGYYAGIVDQFDGIFQRLHIESGPHRIEVRAAGYEPLVFDIRISPDHTTTYEGEMKKIS